VFRRVPNDAAAFSLFEQEGSARSNPIQERPCPRRQNRDVIVLDQCSRRDEFMQRFPATPQKQAGRRAFDRRSIGGRPTSAANDVETFEFGRFSLLRRSRRLLADGAPVVLGTRAFDILMLLIEADGMLVTKRELLSRVWPDVVVDECSLKVQVSALRKALGTDRDIVLTQRGRGYSFAARARANTAAPQSGSADDAGWLPHHVKNRRIGDRPATGSHRCETQPCKLAMLVTHPTWQGHRLA
jgi:DNA-binding winged helix-turn-helix (wHTH) protein